MKSIVRANKVYTCDICQGNIQKGEKHIHEKIKYPRFNVYDNQIGIEYAEYRHHNKDCFPRLLNMDGAIEILKNCNFGTHNPTYDMNPDSCDGAEYCEWCGKILY